MDTVATDTRKRSGEEVFPRVKHATILSFVAFALHLLWESVQCPVFFVHGTYEATWIGMLRASLGDLLLTWMLFAFVAAACRAWRWDRLQRRLPWLLLVSASLALGVGIELRALAEGRWFYSARMPTFPFTHLGVVPLIQLVVLTPVAVLVAGKLARRWHSGTNADEAALQEE